MHDNIRYFITGDIFTSIQAKCKKKKFSLNTLRFSVNKSMNIKQYCKFRLMYIINRDVLSIS